jgi:hypothetical protein
MNLYELSDISYSFVEMFIVFYNVKIVYILCIYVVFHNLQPLWHTYEPMESK